MINVALFGFGRIGQMHAENLNKIKEIKLLYVYEKINQLSNKAKKLYGCKIEKNYNKIFNDNKVDIVFISSSTNTHIKFIEEGIKRKKTIFCEKPLDLNIKKIIKTLKKVKKLIHNPIVIAGGCKNISSIKKGFDFGANGCAAGSLFVYYTAKKGILINYPDSEEFKKYGVLR